MLKSPNCIRIPKNLNLFGMLKRSTFYFKQNVILKARFVINVVFLFSIRLDGESKKWKDCSREDKLDFIIYLLEQCELVDRTRRCQAMRAILYIVQVVFYQCVDTDEYMTYAKENVLLLYTCDAVHIFIDLFNMEMAQ